MFERVHPARPHPTRLQLPQKNHEDDLRTLLSRKPLSPRTAARVLQLLHGRVVPTMGDSDAKAAQAACRALCGASHMSMRHVIPKLPGF